MRVLLLKFAGVLALVAFNAGPMQSSQAMAEEFHLGACDFCQDIHQNVYRCCVLYAGDECSSGFQCGG